MGATGTRQDVHNLWANTLLRYGTEELEEPTDPAAAARRRARCACSTPSPGPGSDLAGLQTRADRDGDEFVDQRAEGVDVERPRTPSTGCSSPARTGTCPSTAASRSSSCRCANPASRSARSGRSPASRTSTRCSSTTPGCPPINLLGELNDGWRVLQTALAYERSVMGDVARGPRQPAPTATGPTSPPRGVGRRGRPRRASPARSGARTTRSSARDRPRALAAHGQPLERAAGQGPARAGHVVADPVARQAGDVGASCTTGAKVHGDDPRRRGDARRARTTRAATTPTSSRSTPTSRRSAAAPTRSSATSSASACSDCPRSPRSTATSRSATSPAPPSPADGRLVQPRRCTVTAGSLAGASSSSTGAGSSPEVQRANDVTAWRMVPKVSITGTLGGSQPSSPSVRN